MNLAMPVLLFTFAKATYRTASPRAPFVDVSDVPFSLSGTRAGFRSVRGRGIFRLRSAWRRGPRQGDEIRVIAQRLEVRQVGQERRLYLRVRWGLPQGAHGRLDALGPDFRS